jgi:hypothetical protein
MNNSSIIECEDCKRKFNIREEAEVYIDYFDKNKKTKVICQKCLKKMQVEGEENE